MAEAAEKKVTTLRKVEVPAPEQAPAAVETKRPARRWRRWILLAAGPLLVAGGVSYFWLTGGRYVSTDNAYIQADIVNIATDVSGLVTKIEVGDNQLVKKGQVLFELDQTTYRTALESAEANVALVRTQLEALRASYAQSAANIAKAESDVTFYEREFQRQTDLANRRVNAEMQLDAARHNLETARGQLAALQQEQAGIAAQLGGDPQAPIEEHPRYKAAIAARDRARTDLEHTVVRASINGRTARVPSLQPGEFLQAGQAAFAIVATDDLWIEANPKETDLTFVQPGQPVSISVDTYPGQEWQGDVASLSPASQAQFSLLPAQNASGNWVKVVQRIPLRIKVHQDPAAPELRAGMSAEIEVDTGHQRHLSDLVSWL